MKYIVLLVVIMVAFGCISISERTSDVPVEIPEENQTEPVPEPEPEETPENETLQPPIYERYYANGFSFEYPIGMSVDDSEGSTSGIFSATRELSGGQTGEIMIVTYRNTSAAYGKNQDDIFKNDPTLAASDFLEESIEEDDVGGLLNDAYLIGEMTTFAIARDGVVAEVPFKIRFGDSNKSYAGHAAELYIPERSLHLKFRVIALDPANAESIYDNFVLSFRLEQEDS